MGEKEINEEILKTISKSLFALSSLHFHTMNALKECENSIKTLNEIADEFRQTKI